MSQPNQCPNCSREIKNAGGFAKHVRVCGRVWTVETLLVEGHVDTSGGPDTCWIWRRPTKFAKKKSKYPYFDGRPAHRTMWITANGDLPRETVVCHSCDTPYCVNLAHLWPGSQSENIQDACAKGRMVSAVPAGDNHWTRKNPEAGALWVRAMSEGRAKARLQKEVMP